MNRFLLLSLGLCGFAITPAFAQTSMDRSARSFIDPRTELRAMNLVPLCNPNAPVGSDGRRLRCGTIPAAVACPAGQAMVGMTGRQLHCRPLAGQPSGPVASRSGGGGGNDRATNTVGRNGEVYATRREAEVYGGGARGTTRDSVTSRNGRSVQGGRDYGQITATPQSRSTASASSRSAAASSSASRSSSAASSSSSRSSSASSSSSRSSSSSSRR
jgi:hypothetical protein